MDRYSVGILLKPGFRVAQRFLFEGRESLGNLVDGHLDRGCISSYVERAVPFAFLSGGAGAINGIESGSCGEGDGVWGVADDGA